MYPVIYFDTLADLLSEYSDTALEPAPVIRVALQQRIETLSNAYGGTKRYVINVFVRAVHEGQILSHVAYDETLTIDVLCDKAKLRADYELAWRQAKATKESIADHLRYEGYDVRAGVIDMGTVQPIGGERWTLPQ